MFINQQPSLEQQQLQVLQQQLRELKVTAWDLTEENKNKQIIINQQQEALTKVCELVGMDISKMEKEGLDPNQLFQVLASKMKTLEAEERASRERSQPQPRASRERSQPQPRANVSAAPAAATPVVPQAEAYPSVEEGQPKHRPSQPVGGFQSCK